MSQNDLSLESQQNTVPIKSCQALKVALIRKK